MRFQKGKFIGEISEPKEAAKFVTTKIIHLNIPSPEVEDCLRNLTLHDLRDLKRLVDDVINYFYMRLSKNEKP